MNWVEKDHSKLAVRQQFELLGLSKSTYYYQKKGPNEENLKLMNRIDHLHLQYPCYGARRLAYHLAAEGYRVSRKRVGRLMALMGLGAVYPKPRTSLVEQSHKHYP